jgi:hypothetical protein
MQKRLSLQRVRNFKLTGGSQASNGKRGLEEHFFKLSQLPKVEYLTYGVGTIRTAKV